VNALDPWRVAHHELLLAAWVGSCVRRWQPCSVPLYLLPMGLRTVTASTTSHDLRQHGNAEALERGDRVAP